MNKIIDLTKRFGVAALSFALPLMASAQSPAVFENGTPPPSVGITSVQAVLDLMCTIFGWAFYFLIALAVIFGVIGAFRYLTSAGEPDKVKEATNTLLYAAIAVAVALLAKAIPLIVANFLGANATIASC